MVDFRSLRNKKRNYSFQAIGDEPWNTGEWEDLTFSAETETEACELARRLQSRLFRPGVRVIENSSGAVVFTITPSGARG